MNFVVDKAANQIRTERTFAASLANVWSAWTQRELLDQWWAPKPWKAQTKSMDFRPGGSWIYAMMGPDGETHWSRADFDAIVPMKSFSALDGFCDENGTIKPDFPRSQWANTFTQTGDDTLVSTVITFATLADLEQLLKLGFREGFTAGLANLDALLRTQ